VYPPGHTRPLDRLATSLWDLEKPGRKLSQTK
jgi:hypothetical protein